jgi:transaldolase
MVLAEFTKAKVDIDALAEKLQRDGAADFVKSWEELLTCMVEKTATLKQAS